MNITYESLCQMFPKVRQNSAQFGLIPIDFFTQNEKQIRKLVRNRVIYRGPRRFKRSTYAYGTFTVYASMTRREDATHALIY